MDHGDYTRGDPVTDAEYCVTCGRLIPPPTCPEPTWHYDEVAFLRSAMRKALNAILRPPALEWPGDESPVMEASRILSEALSPGICEIPQRRLLPSPPSRDRGSDASFSRSLTASPAHHDQGTHNAEDTSSYDPSP